MSRTKGHTHPTKCKSCKYWKHGYGKGDNKRTHQDNKAERTAEEELDECEYEEAACRRKIPTASGEPW